MAVILCFNGSRGARVLLSVISGPAPWASQWSSFTPLPMNRTAKRFGKASGPVEAAKAGRDSSHGKAMVTPAPRRTVRREIRSEEHTSELQSHLNLLFRLLLYTKNIYRSHDRNCQ